MPIPEGHDLAKRLVDNFRNQVNFGGGFEDVKALFEYAVQLENAARGGQDTQREYGEDLDDDEEYDDDEHCEHCDTGLSELYEFHTLSQFYRVVAANMAEATQKLVEQHGTDVEREITSMKKVGVVTV